MAWTNDDVEINDGFALEEETTKPIVTINGVENEYEPGTDFIITIKEVARKFGMSKFRVFIDDDEVNPVDCPKLLEADMYVEIRQYDDAA